MSTQYFKESISIHVILVIKSAHNISLSSKLKTHTHTMHVTYHNTPHKYTCKGRTQFAVWEYGQKVKQPRGVHVRRHVHMFGVL